MAKGNLTIVYSHSSSGRELAEPKIHTLKEISVRQGMNHDHQMYYEFDDGLTVLIDFKPDGIQLITDDPSKIEIYEYESDEEPTPLEDFHIKVVDRTSSEVVKECVMQSDYGAQCEAADCHMRYPDANVFINGSLIFGVE